MAEITNTSQEAPVMLFSTVHTTTNPNGIEVHELRDIERPWQVRGFAAATNPRNPGELTVTTGNGITLVRTASSIEDAEKMLLLEESIAHHEFHVGGAR